MKWLINLRIPKKIDSIQRDKWVYTYAKERENVSLVLLKTQRHPIYLIKFVTIDEQFLVLVNFFCACCLACLVLSVITCLFHFQSGPRITRAPTPSMENLRATAAAEFAATPPVPLPLPPLPPLPTPAATVLPPLTTTPTEVAADAPLAAAFVESFAADKVAAQDIIFALCVFRLLANAFTSQLNRFFALFQ